MLPNSKSSVLMSRAARMLSVATLPLAAALVSFLAAAPADASDSGEVPFKEFLTLVDFGPEGELFWSGQATHLGQVEVEQSFNPEFDPTDPDSVFSSYVKHAANGDTVYGRVIPDDYLDPFTTGTVTIDGGTGRFEGATGTSSYVILIDPETEEVTLWIEGSMSAVGRGE